MPKKKARKRTAKTGKPGTMSVTQLVGALAKALTADLASDERRTFTVRVANAKQKSKKRKR